MLKKIITMIALLAVSSILFAVEYKVAYVDVSSIINKSIAGKEGVSALEKTKNTYTKQVNSLQEDVRVMIVAFNNTSLKNDERRKLQEEILAADNKLKNTVQKAQNVLAKMETDLLRSMFDSISNAAKTIAIQRGYVGVMNSANPNILYYDEKFDITDEVLKRFDSEYKK